MDFRARADVEHLRGDERRELHADLEHRASPRISAALCKDLLALPLLLELLPLRLPRHSHVERRLGPHGAGMVVMMKRVVLLVRQVVLLLRDPSFCGERRARGRRASPRERGTRMMMMMMMCRGGGGQR